MKKVFKILGFLVLAFLFFIAYVVWVNIDINHDSEDMLASLPEKVTPKYSLDRSRNWWKETSVYQIYPRSFKDSDGDGIGDIKGIIEQLDYIQSLGIETIWFSPFFKSPQTDHGYDISDFKDIQPEYGDMRILDSLITEVHNRDMKIVLDLVLNHTSIEHPWFQESKSSKNNPKHDWYVWKDGKNEGPPNNWKNIMGQVSAWNYVPERGQYYYAAFLPFQPDLNMANPEVKEEIFNLVKFWLDKEVDGFRLDIFNFIFENENYPDNPTTWRHLPKFDEKKWAGEEHIYNFHQPEIIAFAKELRAILESYPTGKFVVGEVFGSHRHMRELLGEQNIDGLNLTFLFDFLEDFEFSAEYFRNKVEEYEAFYPYPMVPTYVFGNHDQFRSITRLDDNEQKAEVMAAFQFTVRGVPFVYMGEEIGMKTGNIPLTEAQDPLSEYFVEMPDFLLNNLQILTNRDNCRTPMQWSTETAAGFSSNENTWLPVQENYKRINVATKLADTASILYTYKDILILRRQSSALKRGQIEFLDSNEPLFKDILTYSRFTQEEHLTVYLNFSDRRHKIKIDQNDPKIKYQKRSSLKDQHVILDGFGILIIEKN